MIAKQKYAKPNIDKKILNYPRHTAPRVITLIILAAAVIITLPSCGKRGPLKLNPVFIPDAVENFIVTQEGSAIKLQWDFPQYGKFDKKKKSFDIQMVRTLYVYYSKKQILGGKFKRKADVIEKFTRAQLTQEITDEALKKRAENMAKWDKSARTIPFQSLSYSVKLPFKLKDLDNKVHYFAVLYKYQKEKSPISIVRLLNTRIPVNPVPGVEITRENKVNKITWKRPQSDAAGKPVTDIAGYNIFRKVEPVLEKKKPATAGTESTEPVLKPIEPQFTRLNTGHVLEEIYEDTDTGTNGKYTYYVTALMSKDISSNPSPFASVEITDTYPPEIPSNLVGFKAKGYMLLMWRPVTDKDLSHYRVYRKGDEEDEFKLLADNIKDTTRYQDKRVRPGRKYTYAVTAVDEKGNESPYSNQVEEQY